MMRFLIPFMAFFAASASADDIDVDVELMLAVDVSYSMGPKELELQRRGYAEALTAPEVMQAIRTGYYQRVAVTYVEWSGQYDQRVIVDWTPEALDGSLQPPEITKDNQTWERFGLQVRFGEESTLGGVRGEVIRDNGSKRYIALGLIGGDSVSEIEDGLVIETDTDQDTDFEPVPTPDDD